jgi:hypothetical protein
MKTKPVESKVPVFEHDAEELAAGGMSWKELLLISPG